jgi:hypothetical protein
MNLKELFKSHLSYWPNEINVSDVSIVKRDNTVGGGIRSLNLWNTYEEIEKNTRDNEWQGLASWSYYGILHSKLKSYLDKGSKSEKILIVSDAIENEFNMFSKTIVETLNYKGIGYESMLKEYLRDN